MTKLMLAVLACFLAAPAAQAKAAFMGLGALVSNSDVVAVIEVTKTERVGAGPFKKGRIAKGMPKKGYWHYGQKNGFRFVEMVKSGDHIEFDKKKDQTLWAEKTFICGRASYALGRYLVFLQRVGANEWITINHHLGGLRIDGGENVPFSWYLEDRSIPKIGLDSAKAKIKQNIFTGATVKVEADVIPPEIYNKWDPTTTCQKFCFHVYTPPKANWAPDARTFLNGFFKKNAVTQQQYEAIVKDGGKRQVKGSWNNGYFIVESVSAMEAGK